MSLPPDSLDPIPAMTARIAHAAFPHGSTAIHLRDLFGTIYHDGMFADLYPPEGQHALAPWRLALVTVLQYLDHLTDQQAADAVRARIDWKYALALSLEDEGFHASALSTFRSRLVAGDAADRLLWAILDVAQEHGLLAAGGRQRTDSTHVLAAVRTLNRLELVGETLRAALEALAVAAPDWVITQVPASWGERYGPRVDEYRLPKGETERRALAQEIGEDGTTLLAAVAGAAAPPWLREMPAVQVLQQVWGQQYQTTARGIRWRRHDELPSAGECIVSPYDPSARYGEKRGQGWVGSKAQVTETVDADQPHLLIQAVPTSAVVPDQVMAHSLWDDLAHRDLLPSEHLMDRGYVDAAALVDAASRAIDLVGPTQADSRWQARAGQGYALADFTLDWEQEQAVCPQGQVSRSWHAGTNSRGQDVVVVRFAPQDCRACPVREQCTRSTTGPRTLALLPTQALHEARQGALVRQETAAFREQYANRAGIEGTISQVVQRTGARRARYRGEAKLRVQLSAEAAAVNVVRLLAWEEGIPRARTRRSHLARLVASAA